ncbi:hypothetical protein PDIG_76910 [Penicillium digitatum PHI26]|uniref:Geranylgeranyl pyrophosphate synthase n=2 Tax=Penicillium digitatum TaxID=36651 RepID=K9FBC6_PEND2|nr:hypothetical protein PDIP_04030 [Penicillium digitatum Pd1]EKV06494.1 hypothetical protein PDIG_76910 [Penicillium digitatum PHI26]EKV21661.1 hypothetical protein PDIP_04030 [Penicillium digitatum Pd1]
MADQISDDYAENLDPEIYANNPAYSSLFNPYIHKQTIIADHVSVQCHIDLNGIDAVGSKFGNLNAHADETDNAADQESLSLENEMLHQAINQSGMTSVSTRISPKAQRKAEVQAKIAAEYLRLDPVFGEWFLNAWQTFTASVQDVRSLEFPTLDDYLAFRIVDAAADWTLYNFRWGSGITLTADEEKIADPMSYIAYAELCLVNDLFSWDKEYAAHVKSHGDVPLVNAVHIVAVTQGLTHCAAKAVVQAEIRAHEERFCFLKEQYEATSSPSESILRWLRLLEHSMAGNWVWSLCVPRYFKVDRNPYTDHLAKFGSDAVRVLTPKMEHKHDIQDNHQVLLKDPSRNEMRNLQLGQGRDLHWSYHTHVPTPAQYTSMVDGKTGGLFRLISRLMRSEATMNSDLDISQFVTLLGRHFQIRDDYQNLQSEDYTKNKGFCDDLDEGKLSFPVILSMQPPGFSNTALTSVFKGSRKGEILSPEMKQYVLEEITARGAFTETKAVLRKLHVELLRLLVETEKLAGGIENWALRLLIMKLDLGDEMKKIAHKSEPAWKINQRRAWKGGQKNGRPIDKACFLRAMEEATQCEDI